MNTSIEKFYPDIIITPGDIILEHMEANNLNQKELAMRVGISKEHMSKIINGKKAITFDTASALEKVLGMPGSFWTNLERNYQENLKRKSILDEGNKELEILKKIPYNEICKRGWLKKKDSIIDKVLQLREFFRVNDLNTINNVYASAFRLQNGKTGNEYAQATWIAYGENAATDIEVNEFDKKRLVGRLPEIRSATLIEGTAALEKIKEIFAECGIVLVLSKELKGTFAHGVTKWLTPDKAMVMISLRGSYTDIIWFSLFHELGHILLHGKRFDYSTSTKREEDEADAFAADYLISNEDYNRFVQNYRINEENIKSFAKSIGIEPGVVVGRLAHDKIIEFSEFNGLKRRYKWSQ